MPAAGARQYLVDHSCIDRTSKKDGNNREDHYCITPDVTFLQSHFVNDLPTPYYLPIENSYGNSHLPLHPHSQRISRLSFPSQVTSYCHLSYKPYSMIQSPFPSPTPL